MPEAVEQRFGAELGEILKEDIIEPIDASQWVSNMVVTPKPNDKIPICGDMRDVNKDIIPDKYPLPTKEEPTFWII